MTLAIRHRPALLALVVALAAPSLASAPDGVATERAAKPEATNAAAAFARFVEARRAESTADADAALGALSQRPLAELHAVLESAAAPGRPDEVAIAATLVLGRFGTASELALAPALYREEAREEFDSAVLAVARRDARALHVLDGAARTASTEVRSAFVRAVEGLATTEAASWIARCAERAPDVRGEALARLGRLAQQLAQPVSDDVFAVVRNVLGGVASDALRDAVIAAGRMEDGDAIPYLVPLLREENAGLRADAAWALERISGLELREHAESWEVWYAQQTTWWREHSDAAFADLEGATPALRIRGLLEVGPRRLSRDRISLRVVPLLEDPDPGVARLAAATLRALRSRVAVPALLDALERPEPVVGAAAWDALRAITRKDLPNDVAAWRAACAI